MADESGIITLGHEFALLKQEFEDLSNAFQAHRHNYAGAANPGGAATNVRVDEDLVSALQLAGVVSARPEKIVKTSMVTVSAGTLRATTLEGYLEGTAENAERLTAPFTLNVDGAVVGSVEVSGNEDVTLNLQLASMGVDSGEFGPESNLDLEIGDSFDVPQITVDDSGVVTRVLNRTITLPANTAVAGTVNGTKVTSVKTKLFIPGVAKQAENQKTYTDEQVYVLGHRLYSENSEVVNLVSRQELTNKTYEGYTLGPACERAVDDTPGGTPNSRALVSSDAFYRHKHDYALADAPNGASLRLHTEEAPGEGYGLVGVDEAGNAFTSTGATLSKDGEVTASTVRAVDALKLPGGSLWIDAAAKVVDISEYYSGAADFPASKVITSLHTVLGVARSVDDVCVDQETRIKLLEANFNTTDENVDDLSDRISAAATAASTLATDVAALDATLTEVKSTLTALGNKDVSIQTDVGAVQAQADALAINLDDLGDKVTALQDKYDDLVLRTEELERSVSTASLGFTLEPLAVHVASFTGLLGTSVDLRKRLVTVYAVDSTVGSLTYGLTVDATAMGWVYWGVTKYDVTVFNRLTGSLNCTVVVR